MQSHPDDMEKVDLYLSLGSNQGDRVDNIEKALYHLILVRMAIIKKSANNKCWRVCGEKGTLLHC